MAHHKQKIRITSDGREIRLRRDRKASSSKLTKRGESWHIQSDPDPDGTKPPTGWVLGHYPLERRRRRKLAEFKRIDRRRILTREEREAFKLEKAGNG